MVELKRAIGLMSGTSMDGIDIALLITDGENRVDRGPSAAMAYNEAFRNRLKDALVDARQMTARDQRPGLLQRLERDLTLLHAVAVHDFLHSHRLKPEDIDVIGFHGQTVLHRPLQALTVQIGDGGLLANETGIPVVYDMRAEDMCHGGQGAPLVPAYHAALANNLPLGLNGPVVFVNIGGISNLTYVGTNGVLVAFDSGPGNMLIDQWMELNHAGSFDAGGVIAMSGCVDEDVAARYLGHRFFSDNQRVSLDRSDFVVPEPGTMSLADGARTLAFVSAAAIVKSASHLPECPRTYVVSGGGCKNAAIMAELTALAEREGAHVIDAGSAGFDGDAMEAEAWAYLAVRSMRGLPLTYPTTTGCTQPVCGGILVRPSK